MKQQSQCKTTKSLTEFDDMCDDVIDSILNLLALEDLANMADTNKRIRNIAGSVFSRKYGNSFISIDHRSVQSVIRIEIVGNAGARFKLLRNFGEYIRFIRLDYSSSYAISAECAERHVRIWTRVLEYFAEYCADSVEEMILTSNPAPPFPLIKPLTNMQTFFYISKIDLDALELNQNLPKLAISHWLKPIEKPFPMLKNAQLSCNDVHSFVSFLRMNKQITKLTLKIHTREEDNYKDLIYSSICENLELLQKLQIDTPSSKRNAGSKTIDTLQLYGWNYERDIFEFDNLEKLTLDGSYGRVDSMNLILRNKGLKILILDKNLLLDNNLKLYTDWRIIFRELHNLEKVTIKHIREKEDAAVLKTVFGNEWDCLGGYSDYRYESQLQFLKKAYKGLREMKRN